MRINRVRAAVAGVLAVMSAFALTACGQTVAPRSDEYVCVYGPIDKGRALVDQYKPGENPKQVENGSQIISIPTSNRFYYMVKDDAIRDPGAASSILATSKDPQQVEAQIAIRFTFKQDKICNWFTNHGRRNGDKNNNDDLGFNTRGNPNTGWARWLNENFGETMKDVLLTTPFRKYTWEQLNLPEAETVADINTQLSKMFSEKLTAYLGDQYFCGVTYDSTKPDVCPDIEVKVSGTIIPTNDQLIKNRDAAQQAASDAKLEQEKALAAKTAEKAKQDIADAQLETQKKLARNELVICEEAKKAGVTDCADYIRAKNNVPAYQVVK